MDKKGALIISLLHGCCVRRLVAEHKKWLLVQQTLISCLDSQHLLCSRRVQKQVVWSVMYQFGLEPRMSWSVKGSLLDSQLSRAISDACVALGYLVNGTDLQGPPRCTSPCESFVEGGNQGH